MTDRVSRRARNELEAAGILDPTLRASYMRCRDLNSRHGRSYYLATMLLPAAKRPYVHALYGFARHADDIVDDLDASVASQVREQRFIDWSDAFLSDLSNGRSDDSVARAVLHTIRAWDLPTSYFADFLASMRADLTITEYETFDDLRRYMWGSAAVIGLQMLPILGRGDAETPWQAMESAAVDLGIAFQLTNFIRDVGDDLRRGRIYLPQESLREFGVDRERLQRRRVDGSIRRLLAHEIERTRTFYRSADPGIGLVHPTSQPCLRAACTLYREILRAVERNQYDVFSRRATVPRSRRTFVGGRGMISAWRVRRRLPVGLETPMRTS